MNESKPVEAVAEVTSQPLTKSLAWLTHRGAEVATSIDRSTPQGRAMLFTALQAETLGLGELLGEPITVQHVVVHPAQSIDEETGGVKSFLRVVLIGPDGELYSCASTGIVEALSKFSWVFGNPPWVPPLKFRTKQVVNGKKRYYTIEVDPSSIR